MSLPPDRVPPRSLPWLFLALAACGSKGDDTATADVYTPAPYLVDEEDPPVATFSADAVGEAIVSAMIAGPSTWSPACRSSSARQFCARPFRP